MTTECVGGEHDQIARMAGTPGLRCVRNEVQRIGGARILRFRSVVEVTNSGQRIKDNVFKYGPETLCRRINRGLRFGAEFDGFRVATSFEAADAPRPPAMLVVADQRPVRIG